IGNGVFQRDPCLRQAGHVDGQYQRFHGLSSVLGILEQFSCSCYRGWSCAVQSMRHFATARRVAPPGSATADRTARRAAAIPHFRLGGPRTTLAIAVLSAISAKNPCLAESTPPYARASRQASS